MIDYEVFPTEEYILNQLSKEQLIYLVEQLNKNMFLISEVCVEESKLHIDSDKAVDMIRKHIYCVRSTWDIDAFKAGIDLKMGKISYSEYRKIIELD